VRRSALAAAGALFLCSTVSSSMALAFQRETTDDPLCTEDVNVNCPHNGTPLEWRDFPVSFFIDPDGSGVDDETVIDAARAAFGSWQSASRNGITFRFGGTASGSSNGDDDRNLIHFRSFTGGRDVFAQSVLTYDVETGDLLDVDVELNSSFDFDALDGPHSDPTGPVDLQAVLTHEAGHLLGLDHENRFGEAVVMFFSDRPGNITHRNLSNDDRSGVRAIYPASSGDSGDGGGGGGCAAAQTSADDRWAVVALLAGLLFATRYRGRR
jgi:hypothetical protein